MFRPTKLLKIFLSSVPLALALTITSLFIWTSTEATNDQICTGTENASLYGSSCPPSPSSTQKGYPFSYVTTSKTYDTYYYGSKPQAHNTKSFQFAAFAQSLAAWLIVAFGTVFIADSIYFTIKKSRKKSK